MEETKSKSESESESECECCQDGKCTCQEGQECACCKEGKCSCKEGECENCAHHDHKKGGKMHEELEALKNDLEQEKGSRMQLLADFVNYRKRVEKDREEQHVSSNKVILFQLIEIIDDFDRAVNLEEDKVDKENDFYKGVQLIRKKLSDLLSMYDIQEITAAPGEDFNPATMEAVSTAPVADPKKTNKILHLVGKGYLNKTNGQVFKPVRVVIGKK